MASSLAQLGQNMNRRADLLPRAVNTVIKEMLLRMTVTIVYATPVDTAEARSNWIISLGVPIQGTVGPYSPYPKYSHGDGQGVGETQNATATIARAEGAIKARLPGQTIILQNNTDHINLLNQGSSTQAPALFVNLGVRAGINALNGLTLELG